MNTNSLLTQLSFGEFSNLALSNEGSGTIRKQDMGKILTYINDGLTDLSIKFRLSEKEVHIQLYEHITKYHLSSRFAITQQPQPDVDKAYILDAGREVFKGDVAKVVTVWDNKGRERLLNDESDLRSVFTLTPGVLTVPYPEEDTVLFIHYLAKPQEVHQDNLDQDLDIPDFLVPPLRAYVASKVFMSMGTNDSIRIGQEYQNQYLMYLNDVQASDALSDSRFVTNSFEKRGWI